ncbi:TPA: B12-binding domain-containing radical SAM protein [Candidatus Poribacteria bacterium]|nr:B12-binding domain-containing radical SAM protein [Candidatus Poribacteria bacterium]
MIRALLLAMPNSIAKFDVATKVPNLGLISMAGNVDASICDVRVADLVLVKPKAEEYVGEFLRIHQPRLVGLSCMSFQYPTAIKLARLVKEYDKTILTVLGGYHPTLMYEEIARSPDSEYVDFIIRGEGEITFNELVYAINSALGYDKIAGLSYKFNDSFRHNPPRELIDLNTLQFPRRDVRLLKKGFHVFGVPLDAIETSRGCTHNCKFCSISRMYGRNFRRYKIDRVLQDIKNAQAYGAQAAAMVDDNITLDVKRLEEICEAIIDARLNHIHYSVQASTRGIASSPKLAQKMGDAGVKLVFLGIESVSQTNLNFLGKSYAVEGDAVKAVRYLKDNGIIIVGGFIVGNADDDEEALWETFRTSQKLGVDVPIFFILTPHTKTEIREELLAAGLVTNPDDFSRYHGFAANIRTKHLTTKQLDDIVFQMYEAYYSNVNYLRFSRIRQLYPAHFWKTVFSVMPLAALDRIKSLLPLRKQKEHDYTRDL